MVGIADRSHQDAHYEAAGLKRSYRTESTSYFDGACDGGPTTLGRLEHSEPR